jgi:hypothetical protein
VSAWAWKPPSYRIAARGFFDDIKRYAVRHWIAFGVTVVVLLLALDIFRHDIQPFAVLARRNADVYVVVIFVLAATSYLMRRYLRDWIKLRVCGSIASVGAALLLMWLGGDFIKYIGQYWRYRTLPIVNLERMPLTRDERVHSLNSIYTLAKSLRDQTEKVTHPTFIKKGDGFCFSMAVEPDYAWHRLTESVDEVLCVPGSQATPDFSRRGEHPVHFDVGENLILSSNIYTCVRRALGPLRFFSYEPDEGHAFIAYDENGKEIWVVPWRKWVGTLGVFFARPEFGGVQIIRQVPRYAWYRRLLWEAPRRVFAGCGTWIPPEDVGKYEYLRGQNLMPDFVSRSYAESFRFQDSFLGPLGYFKSGDVRVADRETDVNRQPYTSFYEMPLPDRSSDKLYDSFALEPHDTGKRPLVTSVFVPSDGIGPLYAYRHARRGEAPMGVSWVETQVKNDQSSTFWTGRHVEEHRYFIRDLADSNGVVKRRLMYLSTVVLEEEQKGSHGEQEVTAGAIPSIAITDSATRAVAWVDPRHPETWDEKVRATFAPLWSQQQQGKTN